MPINLLLTQSHGEAYWIGLGETRHQDQDLDGNYRRVSSTRVAFSLTSLCLKGFNYKFI